MDGEAKSFAQYQVERAVLSLRRSNDRLERENSYLRDFCIYQKKKLDILENQTGWDKFNDSLLTLEVHQYQDAIDKLVSQRSLSTARPINARAQGRPLQRDMRGSTFLFENQPPHQTPNAVVTPRLTTDVNDNSTKTEVKKAKLPALRRVDSAFGLAIRFTSLFKNRRKQKAEMRATEDAIAEEGDQEKTERLQWDYDQHLITEQKIRPHIVKSIYERKIAGTHDHADKWRLQQAQQEYKKSLEHDTTPLPPQKNPKRMVSRRQCTKQSQEFEERLVVAIEKDLLSSFPRNKGSIRTLNWPEGSREDEAAFDRVPQAVRRPPDLTHQSRPGPTRAPPSAPAQEEDDMLRVATPPGQMTPAPENPRVQRLRDRFSAPPTPSPRFVTYRAKSPSPGGDEPMPANPVPSWLRTRTARKEREGGS